ncbi:GIY-YIG nuclease family protein [Candidatus Pelagibacter ubique]|nr:GIY-YIG nuclease family protein [Candidatus Pelagibacter ubique]
MYRPYYRSGRRRKKKKIIKSDLELLNYSLNDLKKIISKTNKKLRCGKCERELAIESLSLSLDPFTTLHNTIKSGPHGIYYKCMQCGMNISIQTKIDFNEDPQLNELENEIKKFRIDMKKAIQYFDEVENKGKDLLQKNRKLKNELQSLNSKKIAEAMEIFNKRRDTCLIKDTDIFTGFGELVGLIEKDYVEIRDQNGVTRWKVKKAHVSEFNDLTNKMEKKYDEARELEKKSNNLSFKIQGLNKDQEDALEFINKYCNDKDNLNLNPLNQKEKEKIEEYHLKNLIKQKEQRIKLLKKIFRTSKGYIYILENDEMPGLYKVGWTERSADERAKELSGTGLPTPYKVAYSKSTNLTADIEKTIHKNLDYCRLRSNREFFKADFSEIKKVVDGTLKEYG